MKINYIGLASWRGIANLNPRLGWRADYLQGDLLLTEWDDDTGTL